jgi:tetratricopeptide (TPR) repeat protein
MVNLGFDYREEKKFAEAEALDRLVLQTQRRVLGPEHPNTLRSMNNLANDIRAQGHIAEAEAMDSQTLEIRRRVLGPESPDTLGSMSSLAANDFQAHKYEQAAALDAKIAEMRARVLGPQNPFTLDSLYSLAADYKALGDYSRADSTYRRSYEAQPDNPGSLNRLAWFLLTVPDQRLRRPQEALELARKSVKLAGENPGKEYNTLGLALIRNKLWDEALTTLNKSVEFNKGSEPTDFFFLAMVYQSRGARADAEGNFARGADLARKMGRSDPDTRELWAEAAKALSKPGPPPRRAN